MIIMVGLPASGKSTRAEEILGEDGNAVRINKDLLRTMLHFDRFTGKNESLTRQAARTLAREFLLDGKNVIIDDTNLNENTLQSWVDLAKQTQGTRIQYERMETPLHECIARDSVREKEVGKTVIANMALKAGIYPKPKNGFVICDIDGTLADIRHRLHFVKKSEGGKKDWKGFFDAMEDDGVRVDVLLMLAGAAEKGHEIVFVSGRPDTYRRLTENFVFKHFPDAATVIMRKAHDKRPDTEVKKEIYDQYLSKYPVAFVIDDRPNVIVKTWIPLLGKERIIDVGSNEFFVEERESLNYWTTV